MKHERANATNEAGLALLIAVAFLLMLSAIGLGALQSATGESSAGGRSARKLRTFFAAEAGLGMVLDRLGSSTSQYPDDNPFDIPQFMPGAGGGFTEVRTGTADNDVPYKIPRVGFHKADGALNVNSPNSYTFGIYRADVVATDPAGGRVELQAQISVSEGSEGYK